MDLLFTILLSISLSMDAFSLAISLGTFSFSLKDSLVLSLITGLFHFFMPIFGYILGTKVFCFINTSFFSFVVFSYIAISMIRELNQPQSDFKLSLIGMILFAFGVSLDSFGVGLTIINNIIFNAFMFSLFSFVFTFFGLVFGIVINKLIGYYANIVGIIIMLSLAISNFVNFCAFN